MTDALEGTIRVLTRALEARDPYTAGHQTAVSALAEQIAIRLGLSDIDVQRAMKEKLGAEMRPYRILGACNPPLAHQAVQAVPDIGLLLPCNVIVREDAPGRVVVGFLDPQVMVQLVNQPEVKLVADAAEARLRRACESLVGSPTSNT